MEYVAIIGGGAAGLAAAIAAARGGAQVTVFEQKEGPGTSILASGNGRCNLSNAHVDASLYRNAPFVARTFAACPPDCVRAFFADLGLAMAQEEGGRLYPTTNKARTVLRVLQLAASERGVRPVCHRMVKHVLPGGRDAARWQVAFMDGTSRTFDAVIVASGGLTPAPLLPDGFAFTRPVGRLCAIKTDLEAAEGLDKVRARCSVSLWRAGQEAPVAQEDGEAQFRSFGLSGIAAFNLSRFAEPGMELRVDFLPQRAQDALAADLGARAALRPWRTAADLLAGLVLDPVAHAVLRQAGCRADKPLDPADAGAVARTLKAYRMPVRALDDRHAQVHRGGFDVEEFDPATLEAHNAPGLHVVGEALDVDGPCGGYNLHWAWTTGLLAGAHAAGVPLEQVMYAKGEGRHA